MFEKLYLKEFRNLCLEESRFGDTMDNSLLHLNGFECFIRDGERYLIKLKASGPNRMNSKHCVNSKLFSN